MKKTISSIIVIFLLFQNSFAQQKKEIVLLHGAHRVGKRADSLMQRWRDYGLGEFIHFGLYSILGGDWKGEHYTGASEWIRSWDKVDKAEYDSLYKQFNPTNFNAAQWAAMAKQMGARYVTITTKHHDGFCLWQSKYTHFTVANSPYKRDIIGPLVDAYNKQGIDVYLYFSIMDWSNPDWRYDLTNTGDSAAFNRFKIFTKNQLTELLTLYPSIKGLWFDGTWDKSWQKSGAFTDSLEQYLKQLHPGLIIGSRLRADDFGNRHFDANGHLMGDYEQGWERKYPATFADTHGNDWDCIMTIPENGWGYQKQWLGHWKTAYELEEILANCNSLDGNLVINFGPKGDGTFRKKETDEAKEIGDWMKLNHEAIYNVHYANWKKQDWGYYTESKDNSKVYMIVFNVPISHNLKILPAKNIQVKNATFLSDKKRLNIEKSDNGVSQIALPNETFNQPFVIVLDLTKGKTEKEEKNNHI
ncbi:alpha-L-fucosidase [Arachidicoccus ginsenosidimutans]|uniref:alpha-L-fucosidase n=1 Tax=Arachidicoccus sp. BS20 TaxID=1850526 RepID=UPI0007F15C60|nr:alpha-L-fucosidase [Arachidicoccus sp. BS20]ANI89407.1 alpha-L-fucosidase [Arachidicoccus sp. BS20]